MTTLFHSMTQRQQPEDAKGMLTLLYLLQAEISYRRPESGCSL